MKIVHWFLRVVVLGAWRLVSNREAVALRRYLRSAGCPWARVTTIGGGEFFTHNNTGAGRIQLRVYSYTEPLDGSPGDDEGICLSIVDQDNMNGVILNGFARPLEAMQFGNSLWSEKLLDNPELLEELVTEKRTIWALASQNQGTSENFLVAHYSSVAEAWYRTPYGI